MLNVDRIRLSYGKREVLREVALALPSGQITAIVGANGCGKSTLLRAMSKGMRPNAGTITLDGEDVYRIPNKRLARRLALLPQNPRAPDDCTVADLVGYGRFPYLGFFGSLQERDRQTVDRCLDGVGLSALRHRRMSTLSGGERQRAWIAMCLAQEPAWLLLDEPTTFLDMGYQYEVLHLIRRMNRKMGLSIVMVLHDINQAARFSDSIAALKDGVVYRQGTAADMLTAGLIREVFGVHARVVEDPVHHCPLVIPCGGDANDDVNLERKETIL